MPAQGPVREMRLVVTATDYDDAVRFYRDVLGMPMRESYHSPDGRVTILEAGIATLEIADPNQAEFIDRVEVGRRVAGHIRVAFEVDDAAATTRVLEAAGAEVIAEATRTPWDSLNARLSGAGRPATHLVPGAGEGLRRGERLRPGDGSPAQPRIALPIASSAKIPMTMPDTTLIRPSQVFVTLDRSAPTNVVSTSHQVLDPRNTPSVSDAAPAHVPRRDAQSCEQGRERQDRHRVGQRQA